MILRGYSYSRHNNYYFCSLTATLVWCKSQYFDRQILLLFICCWLGENNHLCTWETALGDRHGISKPTVIFFFLWMSVSSGATMELDTTWCSQGLQTEQGKKKWLCKQHFQIHEDFMLTTCQYFCDIVKKKFWHKYGFLFV